MEFEGTKGSWEVGTPVQNKSWVNIKSEKGIIARTFWGEEEPIVTIEEAQANAKLIASAPELLEMLKDLLVVVDWSYETWQNYKGVFYKEQVESLIKKATEL